MGNDNKTKLFDAYPIEDYLQINAKPEDFPKEEYIAYAVCGKECGYREFIVDGQTQVCKRCHRLMFRTEVRRYILVENDD